MPDVQQMRDETDWHALPDGVECVWRSSGGVFAWHLLILIELLAMDTFMLVSLAKGALGRTQLVPMLFTGACCAVFTPLFASSVVRGIRGRGLPSRLRASLAEGVLLWRRVNESPKIAVPRGAIADVRVESDPWAWWCRQWRLVIVLRNGWRTRRVLFGSMDRGRLDGTCHALRHGLQLH